MRHKFGMASGGSFFACETQQPSTSCDFCLAANFISPLDNNIVIVKSRVLEVYAIEQVRAPLIQRTPGKPRRSIISFFFSPRHYSMTRPS